MDKNIMLKAEYLDIILNLIYPPYNINSLTKIIFISFLVKYENQRLINNFKGRKEDIINIFIKNNAYKLNTNFNDFKEILESIDILVKTSIIEIKGDNIIIKMKKINLESQNKFLEKNKSKNKNPIQELNKLSPQTLIEEVLVYV